METATILSHVDHTLLKPEATWDQIKTLCDEAMEFGCATVCIPPSYVKRAAEYVQGNLKICTVIGFPNGYNTMAAKIFETKDAVENGASEIDMVINLGWVKDRNWKDLAQEIAGVKAACLGRPLKVIIETCLLSDMEKIKLCQLVAKEGADYLKNLHRLLHRRRHPGGCGPVQGPHRPRREDQGRGRHLQPPGRRGLHGPGRGSPGHVPDRQAGEGRARRGILSRTERGTGPQGWPPFLFLKFYNRRPVST